MQAPFSPETDGFPPSATANAKRLTAEQRASDAELTALMAEGGLSPSAAAPSAEEAEELTELGIDPVELVSTGNSNKSKGPAPGSQLRRRHRRLPGPDSIQPSRSGVTHDSQFHAGRFRMAKNRGDIPIYYAPEELGDRAIRQLLVMWKFAVPISTMLRKINIDRLKQGFRPLAHIDLYTFFYKMCEDGRITQRREPSMELTLEDAKHVYLGWREGVPSGRLVAHVRSKKTSHPHIQAFIRSITTRYREVLKGLPKGRGVAETSLADLMKYAERLIIGEHSALVIFPHKLPTSLRPLLRAMPCFASVNDPDASCDSETIRAIAESLHNPHGEHFEFYDREQQEARRNAPSETKQFTKELLHQHGMSESQALQEAANPPEESVLAPDVTSGFRFRGGSITPPEVSTGNSPPLPDSQNLSETTTSPDVSSSEPEPESSTSEATEVTEQSLESILADIDELVDIDVDVDTESEPEAEPPAQPNEPNDS